MKIKESPYTIKILCNMYDAVSEYNSCNPTTLQLEKEYKAIINIIDNLFLKLKKKLLTKAASKKEISFSIEYFEAYYLMNYISANISFIYGFFEQNLVFNFSRKIHQQL